MVENNPNVAYVTCGG